VMVFSRSATSDGVAAAEEDDWDSNRPIESIVVVVERIRLSSVKTKDVNIHMYPINRDMNICLDHFIKAIVSKMVWASSITRGCMIHSQDINTCLGSTVVYWMLLTRMVKISFQYCCKHWARSYQSKYPKKFSEFLSDFRLLKLLTNISAGVLKNISSLLIS
jgi:hypothetical protein